MVILRKSQGSKSTKENLKNWTIPVCRPFRSLLGCVYRWGGGDGTLDEKQGLQGCRNSAGTGRQPKLFLVGRLNLNNVGSSPPWGRGPSRIFPTNAFGNGYSWFYRKNLNFSWIPCLRPTRAAPLDPPSIPASIKPGISRYFQDSYLCRNVTYHS